MAIDKYMRLSLRIAAFLILCASFSCEKLESLFIYCPDCRSEEPLDAKLEIILNESYSFTPVRIKVFEGNLEDNNLTSESGVTSLRLSIYVPLNKIYTLTAEYISGTSSYIVVNSVFPRVRYNEDQCDGPCYIVYDDVVDLKLKYTN